MQIVVIKMESVIANSAPQLIDPSLHQATDTPDGDVMETSRRNDYWDDDLW